MNKTAVIKKLAVFLVTIPSLAQAASTPLHWDDCFHAAVQKMEIIADQDELILQAHEKHVQAIGVMLPQVSAIGSNYNLSLPTTAYSSVQSTVQFTVDQPLFRGFRDYAGLRQTGDSTEAAKQTKQRALVQLYQSVATAFFQVLAAERDIANVDSEEKLYQKQIDQLNEWLKIGRSRKADVIQTQSQSAQLLATLEASRDQLNTARESLAYLTGLDQEVPIEDSFPPHFNASLGPLSDYLSSIEHRPEIVAASLNQNAAEEGVLIAKGAHLPSVDLVGDVYALRTGVSPYGNGSGSWDVLLSLSLPIFSGGVTQSQVRAAVSQYRENELFVSQDRRLADQEIRTYWKRVHDDEAQVKALAVAKNLAWESYQQEMKDYGQSMATNIDALQSLTSFTTTERSLDQVRFQKRIDYLYLQAATGKTKEIPY